MFHPLDPERAGSCVFPAGRGNRHPGAGTEEEEPRSPADRAPRQGAGADFAGLGSVSQGARMATRRLPLDAEYPPICSIPGRGLPCDASGPIPTPQLRLARACGLLATSLLAAALLALGPAVIIAKIASRGPVIVALTASAARPDVPSGMAADQPPRCWLSARPRRELRAEPMIVAGATGAPRSRSGSLGVPVRGHAALQGRGLVRLAALRRHSLVRRSQSPTPTRRQRPPPGWSDGPSRPDQRCASHPATPPHARCGPDFLSPVA